MSREMSAPPQPPLDIPAPYTGPPRILACSECHTRIAHTSGLISTAFRGHSGKAAMFTETRNIALDPPSILLMDSGTYTIQEFICKTCEAYLGWRFVRAHDGPERWKEGHFILELDFVQEQGDTHEDDGENYDRDQDDDHDVLQTRAAQEIAELLVPPLSADPKPPKGVKQGRRSVMLLPKKQKPRRLAEVDDFDDGPFWKPR
ncbi:hypothetical protein OH76DRAFT_1408177 [Lentinus brumalis]|uniref:Yippee domain-containing protein n=1 Tax=Lentinus brumalis TaxID=2498619 RepID=A0A371CYR9_9APHY|nr:hypothetical protein OH76DRAFT_1408177 [Polyporus brumalis]